MAPRRAAQTHCFLLADPAEPSAAGRAPPAHTRASASASYSRKREKAQQIARRLEERTPAADCCESWEGRREKGGVSVKVAAFRSRRGRRRRHEGRRRRCLHMRPRVRASARTAGLRAIGRVCRHGAERLDRARFESSSAAHARKRLRTHAPRAHTAAAPRPAPPPPPPLPRASDKAERVSAGPLRGLRIPVNDCFVAIGQPGARERGASSSAAHARTPASAGAPPGCGGRVGSTAAAARRAPRTRAPSSCVRQNEFKSAPSLRSKLTVVKLKRVSSAATGRRRRARLTAPLDP